MSFQYRLPPNYELTPIPTDDEQRRECKRLAYLLDRYENIIRRIDGLVSYGIGISSNNWCKVCVKFVFSHKFTALQMLYSVEQVGNFLGSNKISNMGIEINQERKPGNRAYAGEQI